MLVKQGNAWVYAVFTVGVLAASLGNLSQTGLNAMLVTVCGEFSVSAGVGQWLTTSYMFVLGAVVPLSSFLMGRFRLKDLVLAAIGLFLAGSLLAVASPSFPVLLAARIAQAVAAGTLLPLLQTIAVTRFPEGRRATAMGVAGVAMGFAPNLGPTVGGAMVDAFGWRSFFVLLAGISAALFLFCAVGISRRDDASDPVSLDAVSFLLCTFGLGGVLLGCSQASSFSPGSPLAWGPVLAGALLFAAFLARQKRVPNPLIDLGIFSSRRFSAGFWGQCLLFASFMGITLTAPLYVEGLCGGSALDAGLVLLPGTIVALVVNPLAGWLADRFGVRRVALAAGAFLAVGSASMAFVCDAQTPLWVSAGLQGVRAVGVSGLISPLTSWSLSELKGRLTADGSAFGLAVRQACASIGTALMVLCVEGLPFLSGEAAFHAAFGVSAAFAVGTFALIVWRVR